MPYKGRAWYGHTSPPRPRGHSLGERKESRGDQRAWPARRGTPLLWRPWGPGEVSCTERRPLLRGQLILWDSPKYRCPCFRGVDTSFQECLEAQLHPLPKSGTFKDNYILCRNTCSKPHSRSREFSFPVSIPELIKTCSKLTAKQYQKKKLDLRLE